MSSIPKSGEEEPIGLSPPLCGRQRAAVTPLQRKHIAFLGDATGDGPGKKPLNPEQTARPRHDGEAPHLTRSLP